MVVELDETDYRSLKEIILHYQSLRRRAQSPNSSQLAMDQDVELDDDDGESTSTEIPGRMERRRLATTTKSACNMLWREHKDVMG